MKKPSLPVLLLMLLILAVSCGQKTSIDRESLVSRHNVVISELDTLASLTVGNGGFAFTVDVTGLQSFPETYSRGIPLGTQSDWGWHSFPDTAGYSLEETMVRYPVNGREVPYSVQLKEPPRSRQAAEYFRVNPHRLHLGIIGLRILNEAGEAASPKDIEAVSQELDLWKGEIRSSYRVFGSKVDVVTVCHPEKDVISFHIESDLLVSGRLSVLQRPAFRYGLSLGPARQAFEHGDPGKRYRCRHRANPRQHKVLLPAGLGSRDQVLQAFKAFLPAFFGPAFHGSFDPFFPR